MSLHSLKTVGIWGQDNTGLLLAASSPDLFCFAEQKSHRVSSISGWLGADAEVFGSISELTYSQGGLW